MQTKSRAADWWKTRLRSMRRTEPKADKLSCRSAWAFLESCGSVGLHPGAVVGTDNGGVGVTFRQEKRWAYVGFHVSDPPAFVLCDDGSGLVEVVRGVEVGETVERVLKHLSGE